MTLQYGTRVDVSAVCWRVVMEGSQGTSWSDETKKRENYHARYSWHLGKDRLLGVAPDWLMGLCYDEHGERRSPADEYPGWEVPAHWLPVARYEFVPTAMPRVPLDRDYYGTSIYVRQRRFPYLANGLVVGKVRRWEGTRISSRGSGGDWDPGALNAERVVPLHVVALETEGMPKLALAHAKDLEAVPG